MITMPPTKIPQAVCDTVKLMLMPEDFKITNSEAFSPSADDVFRSKKSTFAIQNPNKQMMKNGYYQPCLTLSKAPRTGGMSTVLLVTASLPKLVLGSNIQEISDSDFLKATELLAERLKFMSVHVHPEVLATAQVCKIDYCKNIILPPGIACSFLLQNLEHADISRHLDVGRSDYRNGGHCIRFHSNDKEIAIYDKVQDYKQGLKSEKRAFDCNATFQAESLEELGNMQILRLENRYSTGKEISKILETVGLESKDHRFCRLFDSKINQMINSYVWQKIQRAARYNCLTNEDPTALFKSFLTTHRWQKSLELYGLVQILKNIGVREIKHHLPQTSTVRKLFKELENTKATNNWMENIYNFVAETIKKNEIIILGEKYENNNF